MLLNDELTIPRLLAARRIRAKSISVRRPSTPAGQRQTRERHMIGERISTLSDLELQNLQGNARRLILSGAPAQKAEAETLLPLIDAEVETRAGVRAAALKQRRADAAAARKRPRQPAAGA
jgi:hypothetical protein